MKTTCGSSHPAPYCKLLLPMGFPFPRLSFPIYPCHLGHALTCSPFSHLSSSLGQLLLDTFSMSLLPKLLVFVFLSPHLFLMSWPGSACWSYTVYHFLSLFQTLPDASRYTLISVWVFYFSCYTYLQWRTSPQLYLGEIISLVYTHTVSSYKRNAGEFTSMPQQLSLLYNTSINIHKH